MNLVDSSGWIEYFRGGKNKAVFAVPLEKQGQLLVSAICFYEVLKRVQLDLGPQAAREAQNIMAVGRLADLDAETASDAVALSIETRLAMADSLILATARRHKAVLWTQDPDFKKIAGVRYVQA